MSEHTGDASRGTHSVPAPHGISGTTVPFPHGRRSQDGIIVDVPGVDLDDQVGQLTVRQLVEVMAQVDSQLPKRLASPGDVHQLEWE